MIDTEERIKQVIELLVEVAEKRGAFSQNDEQFAMNVIENASKKASKSTDILQEVLQILAKSKLIPLKEWHELQELIENRPLSTEENWSLSQFRLYRLKMIKYFEKIMEKLKSMETEK